MIYYSLIEYKSPTDDDIYCVQTWTLNFMQIIIVQDIMSYKILTYMLYLTCMLHLTQTVRATSDTEHVLIQHRMC